MLIMPLVNDEKLGKNVMQYRFYDNISIYAAFLHDMWEFPWNTEEVDLCFTKAFVETSYLIEALIVFNFAHSSQAVISLELSDGSIQNFGTSFAFLKWLEKTWPKFPYVHLRY